MKTRNITLLAGTALLVAASVLASPAVRSAEAKDPLFLNLTSSEVWRAGMALQFGHNVLKSGHPVTVFLNVDAVTIAARDIPQHTNAIAGKDLQAMVKAILDDGGQVIVCPMCMKQAGLTADDLMEGVTVGKPDITVPALFAPGSRVMSY